MSPLSTSLLATEGFREEETLGSGPWAAHSPPRLPAERGAGQLLNTQLTSAVELALVGLLLGPPACGWCITNHIWLMS